MGNQLAPVQKPLDVCLSDLPEMAFRKELGGNRFLRSFHFQSDEGHVVVKVYVLRETGMGLKTIEKKLQAIHAKFQFATTPNVLPMSRLLLMDHAAYQLRQFVHNNIASRGRVRPFPTAIENYWATYQLLCAVEQIHTRGVCHGDIKIENVVVTSWQWVFLCDFAPYKPVAIRGDNPADFSFFFDTSGKRHCTLAPERFYFGEKDASVPSDLTPEMDIFSLGCVIAQLWEPGNQALFDLSTLLDYQKGTYDPLPALESIPDETTRSMVAGMIQIDPKKRKSAESYIKEFISRSDAYSYNLFAKLHSFFGKIVHNSSNAKILKVEKSWKDILKVELREQGGEQKKRNSSVADPILRTSPSIGKFGDISPTSVGEERMELAESKTTVCKEDQEEEEELRKLESLLKRTEDFIYNIQRGEEVEDVDGSDENGERGEETAASEEETSNDVCTGDDEQGKMKANEEDENGIKVRDESIAEKVGPSEEKMKQEVSNVAILLVTLLYTSLTGATTSTVKVKAIKMLGEISLKFLPGEMRVGRAVPFLVAELGDSTAQVRVTALKAIASVLKETRMFHPEDSDVFQTYIFPSLEAFSSDADPYVRTGFASSIATFAEAARRFLEISQVHTYKAEQAKTHQLRVAVSFDTRLAQLHDSVSRFVSQILMDEDPEVRRALVCNLPQLCIFFGSQNTTEFVFPLLTTVATDSVWEIRYALYESIIGVAAFVGVTSMEAFVIPFLLPPLTDEEEFVINRAMLSLATLCELQLYDKLMIVEVTNRIAPLLCHPNPSIRKGAVKFVVAVGSRMSLADIHAYIVPILRPFFRRPLFQLTVMGVLEGLKVPLSRSLFEGLKRAFIRSEWVGSPTSPTRDPLKEFKGKVDEDLLMAMSSYFQRFASAVHSRNNIQVSSEAEANKLRPKSGRNLGGPSSATSLRRVATHDAAIRKDLHKTKSLGSFSPSPRENVYSVEFGNEAVTEKVGRRRGTTSLPMVVRNVAPGETQKNEQLSLDVLSPNILRTVERKSKFMLPPLERQLPRNKDQAQGSSTVAKNISTGKEMEGWVPRCVPIITLNDHTREVNRVVVSKDNKFFVSCSSDGTVKIWDINRLLNNLSKKPRITYGGQEGSITGICILEDMQSIASCSDKGTIHLFRLEYVSEDSGSNFQGLSSVRQIAFRSGHGSPDVLTGMESIGGSVGNVIVYSTQKGEMKGVDIRDKREIFEFKLRPHLGGLTTFSVLGDYCVLAGSGRGFLSLYDLRFQLPIAEWQLPGKSRVHRIAFKAREQLDTMSTQTIYVAAGGSEVTEWELPTFKCKTILHCQSSIQGIDMKTLKSPPSPVKTRSESLSSFTGANSFGETPAIWGQHSDTVRAMYVSPEASYIVTGGSDRRLRYWDLKKPESSFLISTPSQEEDNLNFYSIKNRVDGTRVISENTHTRDKYVVPRLTKGSISSMENGSYTIGTKFFQPEGVGAKSAMGSEGPGKLDVVRSNFVHQDTILNVNAFSIPRQTLITSTRDGKIILIK